LDEYVNYVCRAVISRADDTAVVYGDYIYFWTQWSAISIYPQYILPVYTAWGERLHVTGNGTHAQWTGEHTYVDEEWWRPDDSDYIQAPTDTYKQSYAFEDWVDTTATINYLEVHTRCRVSDTDDNINLFFRSGGADYDCGALGPTIGYDTIVKTFMIDPSDSAAWTVSDINGMEWGVEKDGTTGIAYLSQMFVKVMPSTIDGNTTYDNPTLTVDLSYEALFDGGYFDDPDYLDVYFSRDFTFLDVETRIIESVLSVGEVKSSNMIFNYTVERPDYEWISGGDFTSSDSVTITDGGASDFDIVGNLTLQTTITIAQMPGAAEEFYFIEKPDAYRIGMESSTLVASIYDTSEYKVEEAGAMVIDTEYTVKMTYDETDVKLYIDSGSGFVEVDSTAHSGSIDTNDNNLDFFEVKGAYDNFYVGDVDVTTPTWVCNYTFEPDEIADNLIQDQTANDNDATFSVGRDQSGFSVWLGPLEPLLSASYVDAGGTVDPEVVIPPPIHSLYQEDAGAGLPFYELFSEAAADIGTSTNLLYIVAAIAFIMGLGFLVFLLTGNAVVAIFAMVVLFSGSVSSGVVPMWILVTFPIMSASLIYVSRQV